MSKIDQGQDMQHRRNEKERIMALEDRETEHAASPAAEEHSNPRDAKDRRGDLITAQLLDMVGRQQRDFTDHLQKESQMIQDLKDGLARVERRVEEFISAFPAGDPAKHRMVHEEQITRANKRAEFWEKIKFAVAVIVLGACATGVAWVAILVWKAALLGPK